MNTTRFLAGTIVGGITLFVVGGLMWGLALANAYPPSPVDRGAPLWLWLVLSQLGYAAMLTVILDKWPRGATAGGGFKAAAIVGFLLAVALGLGFYSMTTLPVSVMSFVDPFLWALYFGIGGAAIGWTIGRGAPPPAQA